MRQAVWSGTINFGLVSIPVRLYPATEPKDVRFHLYDRRTGRRVRYERVTREWEAPTFTTPASGSPSFGDDAYDDSTDDADTRGDARTRDDAERRGDGDTRDDADAPDEGDTRDENDTRDEPVFETRRGPAFGAGPAVGPERPVDEHDVVRGIELPTGDFVTVSDDELEAITPERSRTIEIEEFVDLSMIDPVFFEKSYYVAPAHTMGADKPYALLLRAMQEAKMVGIGRFVLRTKPHLVAIRPLENAIGLETLFFGDEVRSADEVARTPRLEIAPRELKMAQQLIGAMATDWVPEKHADTYREELLELLRSKPGVERADGVDVRPAPIVDLMAALKASVEAAKRRAEAEGKPKPKRKTG